jgi:hypothetical protein
MRQQRAACGTGTPPIQRHGTGPAIWAGRTLDADGNAIRDELPVD